MAKKGKSSETSGAAGTIKIQLYRSTIGAPSNQKVMVRSIGITKLNQVVERPDTPAMRGVVEKAPHLLRIVD